MTAIINPSTAAIKAIAQIVAQRSTGDVPADAFVHAALSQVSLEDFELQDQQAWVKILESLLQVCGSRTPGVAAVRVNQDVSLSVDGGNTRSSLEIVTEDFPFLVDSFKMVLDSLGISCYAIVHPVISVERAADGRLKSLPGPIRESVVWMEIERQTAESAEALVAAVRATLEDVRVSVADWQAMRTRMLEIADIAAQQRVDNAEIAPDEAKAFLQWAADNHFTFLGFREYTLSGSGDAETLSAVPGTGLGLLRDSHHSAQARPVKTLGRKQMERHELLILTKTAARASVHRPTYMDYIGVLRYGADGRAVGEYRFIGLYTTAAYNRRPWEIPVVRRNYEKVMDASGLSLEGHSGKALRQILETLPREELFQATPDQLLQTSVSVLSLQERFRPKLYIRKDPYGRFYSVLIYLPKDRFNTEIRTRIEAMLMAALDGERIDKTLKVGDSPLAQLHLLIRHAGNQPAAYDLESLEAELGAIIRNWKDELRDALIQGFGEERGIALAARYLPAMPQSYVETVTPAQSIDDIRQMERLQAEGGLTLNLYEKDGALRFKLFSLDREIALSDALPMLENLGMKVLTENPYTLHIDGRRVVIQDFALEATVPGLRAEHIKADFEQAFGAVWRGQSENDGFNKLVSLAGLGWRRVSVLRAYGKYLLQIGVPFSQSYMEETLQRYPALARILIGLFDARFNPDLPASNTDLAPALMRMGVDSAERYLANFVATAREEQIGAVDKLLGKQLAKVASLDEDRILRAFATVMHATLRTSFFQGGESGHKDYVSFKFDPSRIPDMPKPVPYREIFVYSPFVEGVHLRFGPVARGGLRWSDRREDFRTEVLGLVKAQMVKNTVIVPVGSKGGFFAKQLPDPALDRDAWFKEGVACYKRFINGLLDITDNIVGGKIVPPANVVRHDQDDPYLVVAADKGTATFSDIANGISAEHGFWLGDAFASGGSVGYDHKGMGITARGAWESVKRHFRALGRNSQTEDFTCVGIGDMSGDVFGNGMLLSEHIRLVAAFDHRHIFIDPNPDAAVSFKERQRLFAVPRSSWEDYDKSLIARGGGVFPRSAKTVALSAEAKAALGIDESVAEMTPNQLMNAILKAPVDLLWNGGIGTYVKSSAETHADCGDRANNGLRVDGRELRCKVVGEGGNLGMTQRGRIEAAQAGVLLNTDFIDNSAGVDTSDHEVNIKILLGAVMLAGELDQENRNALLASMTDEVGELVLVDNYRQNQALSVMESMSAQRLGSFTHFIQTLESQGLLDRAIEFLPSDAELAERKAKGQGLTRPELAVLLSYDKIVIFNQLLDSDVPEDPYLSKELQRYFPQPLQDKYAEYMLSHRLRREIIATAVTNSLVNRMGSTFLLRMQEDTGETPAQIAKAYTIVRESMQARALWAEIDALDNKVPESVQIQALTGIWHLQRKLTRWMIALPGLLPDIARMVERYQEPFSVLLQSLPGALTESDRGRFEAEFSRLSGLGMSAQLAHFLAALPYLDSSMDIIELSLRESQPVKAVAQAHFALSEALHINWLMAGIEALPVTGRWQAQARGVLRDELQAQQRQLVSTVLGSLQAGKEPSEWVEAWLSRDDAALKYTLGMFTDMRSLSEMDFPTLSVAVRRLAQIASTGTR
ncbi:glutamate dehydrogenase [Arenimonas maotaiensis]|uniref:Glutamate dehydrogenase n=1 Tax=Arenimonas maotaiensis TaxID=1446479 RepID=A0A917CBQ2_9GAMM|nr:NAD-glutamate dehydrogenase [Arenimonas maotaiensis]GGF82873.1 glutamate dehydrogenase [Arenimonas maotaiensis]